jgi:hypothetical protein
MGKVMVSAQDDLGTSSTLPSIKSNMVKNERLFFMEKSLVDYVMR